ncbi:MAG: ribonuclease III [Clostridia bacterium]|nr:ribonuclease III [Clostridia bacterium]
MEIKLNELSQSALAYLGDSVVELCVRTLLVKKGYTKSKTLNAAALEYVTASAQAKAVQKILPFLTEEEAEIYRRGRNMSVNNIPKSASCGEYKMATGFEVLFGYLHIAGRTKRIEELFSIAYDETEINGGNKNE